MFQAQQTLGIRGKIYVVWGQTKYPKTSMPEKAKQICYANFLHVYKLR